MATAGNLSGALASSVVRCIVKGYAIETSTSTHVVQNIAVPKFRAQERAHRRLCELSGDIHSAVGSGDLDRARASLEELDAAAASLWGLTDREMKSIHDSLELLGGAREVLDVQEEDEEPEGASAE